MCLNKIKPTPKLAFWLIAITCVILIFIPAIFALPGCEFFDLSKDDTARIGDSIGGITAPFVAILAAVLTFLAFWVQYEFNEKQQTSIEKQRFEHNFYEMLNIHESITQSLKLMIIDENSALDSEDSIVAKREGRGVFQLLYEYMPITANSGVAKGIILPNAKQYKGLKELFQSNDNRFEIYENNNAVSFLDHYFRQLYSIFTMIIENKNLDNNGKYEYCRIVRSTLSQYELLLLFYNCLSSNGVEKFKPIIEDWAIMNNLRKDMLAKQDDEELYKESAYSYSKK